MTIPAISVEAPLVSVEAIAETLKFKDERQRSAFLVGLQSSRSLCGQTPRTNPEAAERLNKVQEDARMALQNRGVAVNSHNPEPGWTLCNVASEIGLVSSHRWARCDGVANDPEVCKNFHEQISQFSPLMRNSLLYIRDRGLVRQTHFSMSLSSWYSICGGSGPWLDRNTMHHRKTDGQDSKDPRSNGNLEAPSPAIVTATRGQSTASLLGTDGNDCPYGTLAMFGYDSDLELEAFLGKNCDWEMIEMTDATLELFGLISENTLFNEKGE
jgi:hypothetical protein